MEQDYGYELKYRYKGTELTMKIPGMITMEELSDRLFEFLCGCGWDRKGLMHIAKGGDLYNPSEEDEDDCTRH